MFECRSQSIRIAVGTYDAVSPTNQFLKISRTQLLSKTESSEKPGTESASGPDHEFALDSLTVDHLGKKRAE